MSSPNKHFALLPVVLALISTQANGRGADLPFTLEGGSVITELVHKKYDAKNPASDQSVLSINDGTIGLKLDFGINAGFISGGLTLDAYAVGATSNFVHRISDRLNTEKASDQGNNVEVYSFNAKHISDDYDLNFFYHVPRYHWGHEGDYFGLLKKTTDMEGQDIWNDKAPSGVEFVGKGGLDGLKVVAGPEIYWGAKQQVMMKYQFGGAKQYTAMFAQEYGSEARKVSLQGDFNVAKGLQLRIGGLISGNEKVGERYDYYQDGKAFESTITNNDTLAAKGRLTYDVSGSTQVYAALQYAGLVANGGEALKEFGNQLPYSDLGNKRVLELGAKINIGSYMITPKLMMRDNLRDANTVIPHSLNNNILNPGLSLRNTKADPFVVAGNRKVNAAEIFLTSDPTPSTYFYEWDNDAKEDAKFAYNVGMTVMDYKGTSDSSLTDQDNVIGDAQAAERLWVLKSKMVFNTSPGLNTVLKLETGMQQASKKALAASRYSAIETKLIHLTQNVYTLKYAKDKFGPYDYLRDYGISYPTSIELGYERLVDANNDGKISRKLGIKGFYRTLDENSGNLWADGANDSVSEVQLYATYKF